MTSASTFPQRLTKIDDLTRPDHFYLTPEDACYFLGEYTARKGYAFSPTNQLVLNFKKSLDKRAPLNGSTRTGRSERPLQPCAGR